MHRRRSCSVSVAAGSLFSSRSAGGGAGWTWRAAVVHGRGAQRRSAWDDAVAAMVILDAAVVDCDDVEGCMKMAV
jgi:hypothetical protein